MTEIETPLTTMTLMFGEAMEVARESKVEIDELHRKLDLAEGALRAIIRCDYRGNEPREQMIARLALADIERQRSADG
jgi:hypothetical protein